MSEYKIISIYKGGVKYASRRKGYLETHQEPEDFGSYCVEQELRGKFKKYSWMFVDYLREGSGRKGTNRYDQAKNLKRATSLNAVLADGTTERIELLHVGGGSSTLDAREELRHVEDYIRRTPKRTQTVITMYAQGFLLSEIAIKLNVTESRISQMIDTFRKKYLGVKEASGFYSLRSLNLETKEFLKCMV
jgi:predicted DNA-binding protein YlxM (UPF0122 family)